MTMYVLNGDTMEAIIKGFCESNDDYASLFVISGLSVEYNSIVGRCLKRMLHIGSVIYTQNSSLVLLILHEPALLCRQSVYYIRGTCALTNKAAEVPLWMVTSIGDCFDAGCKKLFRYPKVPLYVTWTGWWSEEDETGSHSWEARSCSDVCYSGKHVILRLPQDRQLTVNIARFTQRALCCSSQRQADSMLCILNELRPGDIIETKYSARARGGLGKGSLKRYMVVHMPWSHALTCAGQYELRRCAYSCGSSPPACGIRHLPRLTAQTITVIHDGNKTAEEEELWLDMIFAGGVRVVSSATHYGSSTPDSFQNIVGYCVYMIKDPCMKLYRVTKTIYLSSGRQFVRLSSLEEPPVEFVVSREELLNDSKFFRERQLSVIETRVRALSALHDSYHRAMLPGDLIQLTCDSSLLRITHMTIAADGSRLYRLAGETDYKSLPRNALCNFILARDIESFSLQRLETTLSVGDAVFFTSLLQKRRQTGKAARRDDSLCFVARLILLPRKSRTPKKSHAVVLARVCDDGKQLYKLEKRLGQIACVLHDSQAQLEKMNALDRRQQELNDQKSICDDQLDATVRMLRK